ncbi:C6 zinc finger domain protein [Aspergillus karnatakaensis]|uniref:Zn(II)2Cys6 transcription factor n=1 Tax=Aspergillus karnatakaensis TaxID=1810916 RepID=UPI003CCD7593
MPPRRSHAKSHHGCTQCKRRRIKCNEARPACASCRRKQLPCAYNSVAPQAAPPLTGDAALIRQVASPLALQDLELLHHWHTLTAASLDNAPIVQDILRTVFPQEGLASPFLLHSILAVAALHKAQAIAEERRDHYGALARAHHNMSLVLCGPFLNSITPLNCHALFGFSCLVPIFVFAAHSTGISRLRSLVEVVDSFKLIRGTCFVVDRARPWINEGPLHPLLRIGHYRQEQASAAKQRALNLSSQIMVAIERVPEVRQNKDIGTTLSSLLHLLHIFTETGDARAILSWPCLANPEFFDLVFSHDRGSMLVLYIFGRVLGVVPLLWWLDGWSSFLVELCRDSMVLVDQEFLDSITI